MKTTEQTQILKLLSDLMNRYGKFGKYDKPQFTKSGKYTKNRTFNYPNESELMQLWNEVNSGQYESGIIFNRAYQLKLELLDMKEGVHQ